MPKVFDESGPTAWRLAAGAALLLGVIALWVSPEFSLVNVGLSLVAGVWSLLPSGLLSGSALAKSPKGSLALWILILSGFWMSSLAGLEPDAKRIVFGSAFLAMSLVFQGSLLVFFSATLVVASACVRLLSADFDGAGIAAIVRSSSIQFAVAALAVGVSILFVRISQTRSQKVRDGLKILNRDLEKIRNQVESHQERIQFTSERLLGRTLVEGESFVGALETGSRQAAPETDQTFFEDVIAGLRKAFSDFQLRGRANGLIAGPVRFVFFAPAAGYDEKSIIGVDMSALKQGVDDCLHLALEALPDIGARRREGVIRLSVRYGIRVIEVSVEDNGRGLSSRPFSASEKAELELGTFAKKTQAWGGKLDRITRLGVGSRTSFELRILSERARSYRTTLRHSVSAVNSTPSSVPNLVASETHG